MEPRIQYAQTTDGVSIAFWTLGKGMPLVLTPTTPFNHIELAWRVPDRRRLFERLAQSGKLVHYDSRGSGLSERNVADYSIESLILENDRHAAKARSSVSSIDRCVCQQSRSLPIALLLVLPVNSLSISRPPLS